MVVPRSCSVLGICGVLLLLLHSVLSQTRATNAGAVSESLSDRTIILTGTVITVDGSPPPERVAIERVCGATVVREGYTDRKGYFNFQVGRSPAEVQDASTGGADQFNAGGLGSTPISGTGSQRTTTYSVDDNTEQRGNGQQRVVNVPPPPGTGLSSRSTLQGCELRAVLAGFRSSSVSIRNPEPIAPNNVGTIVLLPAEKPAAKISATSLRAPKEAKKAYEKATADLRKQKTDEAQVELQKAIKLYPNYAAAWNELGWIYARQNRFSEARDAFAQARSADDGFVPPYVGLAALAAQESKWSQVLEFSSRATQLDAVGFPSAHYYTALARYQLGEIDEAEKTARRAERLDAQHSFPLINLLLGTILSQRKDYAGAAEQFKFYLKLVPSASNAEKVRQQIAELEKMASAPAQPMKQ